MRELGEREIDRVSGGVFNLGTGVAGALIGGGFAGARYAVEANMDGSFSWGEFALTVSGSAASGLLVGTGVGLVGAAARGVLPGAAVPGVTAIGLGGIIQVTMGLEEPEHKGGS